MGMTSRFVPVTLPRGVTWAYEAIVESTSADDRFDLVTATLAVRRSTLSPPALLATSPGPDSPAVSSARGSSVAVSERTATRLVLIVTLVAADTGALLPGSLYRGDLTLAWPPGTYADDPARGERPVTFQFTTEGRR